ncbi:hypothetical protein [Paraferrimonas sedimenticola]|uniref:Uncharacterized protein n=1 Tax=Paraferrimonas sedimenticola TaxID=375674 RepID=A0AA37W187_9GAMM|nr:hypothetical protein [Paraferrimonas sedimenticola]GLP97135.1 hypothetical protein GCM10007895_24420 [Paraferrimonas sedimenticola]
MNQLTRQREALALMTACLIIGTLIAVILSVWNSQKYSAAKRLNEISNNQLSHHLVIDQVPISMLWLAEDPLLQPLQNMLNLLGEETDFGVHSQNEIEKWNKGLVYGYVSDTDLRLDFAVDEESESEHQLIIENWQLDPENTAQQVRGFILYAIQMV